MLTARCRSVHVDPFQQQALGNGALSHWLQPWRSYSDTFPAARMREAPAFGLRTENTQRERARADLFAAAGFRRAIIEVQWQDVDPANPGRLGWRRDQKRGTLALLRERGIRPVILVDAYATLPRRELSLTLAAPAAIGARQVRLDPGTVGQVVPGRTLLEDALAFIQSVDAAGNAILSKPLPEPLPSGPVDAAVVTYLPFPRPFDAGGRPDPAFEEPMNGWLAFIAATAREAKDVLGSDAFDLLVWNGAGSPVLDRDRYFDPPAAPRSVPIDATLREILSRTLSWMRDPRNGVSGARVIDGFTNRRLDQSGATELAGVDAFSRHLSVSRIRFPPSGRAAEARWLDVGGRPNGERGPDGIWREAFTPRYSALFPELFLTALTPAPVLPDLAPTLTRDAAGVVHGRSAAPAEGRPPEVAITAFGFNASEASDGSPLTPAEIRRATTKAALRALAAYVGKGASLLGFYEGGGALDLAAEGEAGGGETMRALREFLMAFEGPAATGERRSIAVLGVSDCSGARQFEGDGSAARPPLHDREVVAVFPFQTGPSRFVVPAYVMSRDLGRLHGAAGPLRTEPAATPFTIELAGLRGEVAALSARDPITGAAVPVEVVRRARDRLHVRLPLTDSPVLLDVTEP